MKDKLLKSLRDNKIHNLVYGQQDLIEYLEANSGIGEFLFFNSGKKYEKTVKINIK